MAKALKPGDQVTVRELLSFATTSEAYKKGLKSVKTGQIGHVIGPGVKRSVIVDFNGVQATITTLRLEKVEEAPQAAPRLGRPKKSAQPIRATTPSEAAPRQSPGKSTPVGEQHLITA